MFFYGLLLGAAGVAVFFLLRAIDKPVSPEDIDDMFRAVGATPPNEARARAAARARPDQERQARERQRELEREERKQAREAEVLDFILRGQTSCMEAASRELVELRARIKDGGGPGTLDDALEAMNDVARREREARAAMIELAKATYGDRLVAGVMWRELGEEA